MTTTLAAPLAPAATQPTAAPAISAAIPAPAKLSRADRRLFRGTAAEVHPWMDTTAILASIGCNFEVLRASAHAGERCYDDCQLWLRSDTADLLGFFGRRRQIIQPTTFIEYFRAFTAASSKAIDLDVIGCLDGGRTLYMGAKLSGHTAALLDEHHGDGSYGSGGGLAISRPGSSAYLASEDRTDHWLILTESFGESLRPRVMVVANELVCSNGLARRIVDCEVKLSHTAFTGPEHVAAVLSHALQQCRAYDAIKDKLAATPISMATAQDALRQFFADRDGESRTVRRLEEIYRQDLIGGELDSRRGTAWGLLSAVTQYTSHERIRQDATALRSQLDGARARTANGFLAFLESQFAPATA